MKTQYGKEIYVMIKEVKTRDGEETHYLFGVEENDENNWVNQQLGLTTRISWRKSVKFVKPNSISKRTGGVSGEHK